MEKEGIDVLMVSPSSNLFYLSGYALKGDERLLLLVLPRGNQSSGINAGAPFILANLLYKEQVKSLPVDSFVYWKDGDDPFSLLKTEIEKRNIKMGKIALESSIPFLFSHPLAETFPAAQFVPGSPLTDPLRQYKDQSELDLIRKACHISDKALAALMDRGSYWLGKTEADFNDALSAEFRRAGLEAFGATVAVGPHAALPHYGVGNAVIEKGNCFLVDFWASLEGYYTDCTRTFYFGVPDDEFAKIHAIVLQAHLAAEANAHTGNTLGDVDFAAREIIEKSGYGECFTHRTGHGLGIDVHEGDSVNKGVNVPLKPGMVFSIEPGIYLPGRYGVRIENLVAIGEKGPEVLHAYPRELRVIE